MIAITKEQKELLEKAKNEKDFYKLKILESYILKLLELNLPKKFVLELIQKETNANIKYSNFLHFVNKHLDKKAEKKEKEKKIDEQQNKKITNPLLQDLI